MKLIVILLLVILCMSCGVRIPEGRARPVYFSADELVFTDSLEPKPNLRYHAPHWLYTPCIDMVYLDPGKPAKAYIKGPTIFTWNQQSFLVYPGDRIKVNVDPQKDYMAILTTINNRKKRDRELQLLARFSELEQKPPVPQLIEYDYSAIRDLELALKKQLITAENINQRIFDSLLAAYDVGRKFRKSTNDYIHHRYTRHPLDLYVLYRDTLLARQEYFNKAMEFLPYVNNIQNRTRLSDNSANLVNSVNTLLYPSRGVNSMVLQGRFDECFDSISTIFRGPARDLLLSRLMYQAYNFGYKVSPEYEKRYRQYSLNKRYRRIVRYVKRNHSPENIIRPIMPNDLLLADGKTISSFENVLTQHKGKYIILDFWASWCLPCLEDQPELEQLQKQFSPNQLIVLNMSIDSDKEKWRSKLLKQHSDPAKNFLFVNSLNAEYLQNLKITQIPRYILIDPFGKAVNVDLPGPKDPQLKRLLKDIMRDHL